MQSLYSVKLSITFVSKRWIMVKTVVEKDGHGMFDRQKATKRELELLPPRKKIILVIQC